MLINIASPLEKKGDHQRSSKLNIDFNNMDSFEIECHKCPKCGQEMHDTVIVHTYDSFTICKCKNRSCIIKEEVPIINNRRNKPLEIKTS